MLLLQQSVQIKSILWDLPEREVTVAVLDTGIFPHKDLTDPETGKSRVIGFKDFINDRTEPYDDNGHGTHCAGDVASNGETSGGKEIAPAPEASLVGIKVLSGSGSGSFSGIIEGGPVGN